MKYRYIFTVAKILDTVEANSVDEADKKAKERNPGIDRLKVIHRKSNPDYHSTKTAVRYPFEMCLVCGKQHRRHSKAWMKCQPKAEAMKRARE